MNKHGIAPYWKNVILSIHRQINCGGFFLSHQKFYVTPLQFFNYSLLKVTCMWRLQLEDTGMWVCMYMRRHFLSVFPEHIFSLRNTEGYTRFLKKKKEIKSIP